MSAILKCADIFGCRRLATIVVAGFMASFQAGAAIETETTSYPLTQTDYSAGLQLAQFDSALGQLQSVTITAAGSGSFSQFYQNLSTSSADFFAISQNLIRLSSLFSDLRYFGQDTLIYSSGSGFRKVDENVHEHDCSIVQDGGRQRSAVASRRVRFIVFADDEQSSRCFQSTKRIADQSSDLPPSSYVARVQGHRFGGQVHRRWCCHGGSGRFRSWYR